MDIFKAFIPISKVDDEQRMVFGYASTETVDSQGEVVERAAIEAALPEYMRFANIREMHTMSAVGVAKSAEVDDKGLYLGAKVVDDTAWMKVKEGVYKGFSIGGRALSKVDGIIKSLRLTEISLVDRPANPECVIDAWKAETLEDKPAEDVSKGLWNAQRLIESLQCLKNAMSDAAYEEKVGEHSAEMLADMKSVYMALGAVVQKYLGEELSPPAKPVEVSMADAGGDLTKMGARYSKSTKECLAKIHGMLRDCDKAMVEMGYDKADDAEKADQGGELSKVDEALNDALAKAGALPGDDKVSFIAKMADDLGKARDRIKELEAQPEPAKAATTAVAKTEDTKDGVHAQQAALNLNDPLSMFKAVLSQPRLVGGAPISRPSSAS